MRRAVSPRAKEKVLRDWGASPHIPRRTDWLSVLLYSPMKASTSRGIAVLALLALAPRAPAVTITQTATVRSLFRHGHVDDLVSAADQPARGL